MRALQIFLVGLILLLLATPLATVFIWKGEPGASPLARWLANRTLTGVILPRQDVPLSRQTWMAGSYQQSVTKWCNENYAGRELAIRLFNQLMWTTARKSYMAQESVVAGANDNLMETQYLNPAGGIVPPVTSAILDSCVEKISRLQDRLRHFNVPVLVLFTPSKAHTQPDTLPSRYARSPMGSGFSDRERLKLRLKAAHVPFFDAADYTRQLNDRLPLPAFPRTGTHWTTLAATHAADELLRVMERLGHPPFPVLQLSPVRIAERPEPPDDDLISLLNLARPQFDRYAYAAVKAAGSAPRRQGRLVEIGGSFLHSLNGIWEDAEVWLGINHYYYYSTLEIHYPGRVTTPGDPASVNWNLVLSTADCVVIEVNEAIIGSKYVDNFLDMALGKIQRGGPEFLSDFPQRDWHTAESNSAHRWRWASRSHASLALSSNQACTLRLAGQFTTVGTSGRVRILTADGNELWSGEVHPGFPTTFKTAPCRIDRSIELTIESTIAPHLAPAGDTRLLTFGLWDLDYLIESPANPPSP